ncbi:hypothetical protein PoB_007718500 [Plakobranchus ocellatus]|uniref:Uncharacterized protein n=1 Tax=Plakobranchus ocellatus TaxID=259542 RepID=A0AAV4E2S1_9GAST|nr:hypothetical protein PoB_007718500 [Plakobranchus ocellatus]
MVWFLYVASPQQGRLRLSSPKSGQGAGGEARTRDRKDPADIRADSLSTVPQTPPDESEITQDFALFKNSRPVVLKQPTQPWLSIE